MSAPSHEVDNGENRRFEGPLEARRLDLAAHIFAVSATLVGVCLGVITLLRLIQGLNALSLLADDVVSADAVMFLGACGAAYSAIRTRSLDWRHRLERLADVLFMAGLALMTAVCAMVTYELI